MEIEERIPDLSDKELENLHANAVRLKESGTDRQRAQAERLLPLLGVAVEERRVARLAAQQDRRRESARRTTLARAALKEQQK